MYLWMNRRTTRPGLAARQNAGRASAQGEKHVLAFAGKHLFPARTVGDVTVPSPLATPTEAKATIDQARRDIDAAAKAAADRASAAE
jgi:hypothetical protein